jgi:Leu/Phe-tRNA-protein transferase
MKASAKSHTHCQVARKADRPSQNLSISMSFANAPKEIKLVANLKENNIEIIESQCTTQHIHNDG